MTTRVSRRSFLQLCAVASGLGPSMAWAQAPQAPQAPKKGGTLRVGFEGAFVTGTTSLAAAPTAREQNVRQLGAALQAGGINYRGGAASSLSKTKAPEDGRSN